jgi:GDPmannose 4,6-dehydratase
MFGTTAPPQNEESPFAPVSQTEKPSCSREKAGLFVCSGILFNHESPRRGEHFVTRKITISLAKIKLGLQDEFSLGNLGAIRDWGFAGDYVKAMHLMLQHNMPDDYVIATGVSRSVRDFVEAAAKVLGKCVQWQGSGLGELGLDEHGKVMVRIGHDFYRPAEVGALRGDYSKASRELGWRPEVSFANLVEMMMKSDVERLSVQNPAP